MSDEETLDTRARSYSKSENKMASSKKKGENAHKRDEKEEETVISPLKELKTPSNDNDWWELFKNIHVSLAGVQKELAEVRKVKGNLTEFSKEWKQQTDNKLQVLELCDNDQDYQLKLLTNIVIRQDEKIRELEGKVMAISGKDRKANIIIEGILENKEETRKTLIQKVTSFFKETMGIEEVIEIQDLYRQGRKGPRDRPVLVRCRYQDNKYLIFKHASNLKGKTNAKKKLYFV